MDYDERIDAIRDCRDFGHLEGNLTGHCTRGCGAFVGRRATDDEHVPRWRERLTAQDRTGEIRPRTNG